MEELKTEKDITAEPEFAALQGMQVLAEGGMATVFKAHEPLLDRTVAVKVLKGSGVGEIQKSRFENEAKTLASLQHPNIVAIHRYGILSSGLPYLIMDFIPGLNLRSFMEDRVRMDGRDFFVIFSQVLHALSASHQMNIVHRDIKPDNIMIARLNTSARSSSKSTTQGFNYHVYLLDFGIAKSVAESATSPGMTITGTLLGTPKYMNPEQCKGRTAVAASDVYSLGCVMFEAICGKVPFESENPAELMYHRINDDPAELFKSPSAAGLSAAMKGLLLKALAREPEDRYQKAEEMLAELNGLSNSDLRWRCCGDGRRGRRLALALGTIAAIVCTTTLALWMRSASSVQKPEKYKNLNIQSRRDINALLEDSRKYAREKRISEALSAAHRAYLLACQSKQVDKQVEVLRQELNFRQDYLNDPPAEIAILQKLVELSKRYVSTNGMIFEIREDLARSVAKNGETKKAIALMFAAIKLREDEQAGGGIRAVLEDRVLMAHWYCKLNDKEKSAALLEKNWPTIEELREGKFRPDDGSLMVKTVQGLNESGERALAVERMKYLSRRLPDLLAACGAENKDLLRVYKQARDACAEMNLPEETAEFSRLMQNAKHQENNKKAS